MEAGAIIAAILMSLLFIIGLAFCFMQIGKGGTWED